MIYESCDKPVDAWSHEAPLVIGDRLRLSPAPGPARVLCSRPPDCPSCGRCGDHCNCETCAHCGHEPGEHAEHGLWGCNVRGCACVDYEAEETRSMRVDFA
jgi:hypothetical protein